MPEPFDAYSEKNYELYVHFKAYHPQWWLEIEAKSLIGIVVHRNNLSEQFPMPDLEPHEWNDLWLILATRHFTKSY